jgi:hypothetical protein
MLNVLDEMIAEATTAAASWQDRLAFLREWRAKQGSAVPPPAPSLPVPRRPKKRKKVAKIAVVNGASAAMRLTDAIRQAIREKPRTQIEVADRVEQLVPGVGRNSINAIIGQRMSAGEFAKTDDLTPRLRIAKLSANERKEG